jgi:hypothetical protein
MLLCKTINRLMELQNPEKLAERGGRVGLLAARGPLKLTRLFVV